MKKVLYVATVDVHIKTFHLPYLKMLHDNGYEVHVATNGNEQFPYCDVKHQICIERSPFKIKNIKAIKELKKIIEFEKFDIIHCHTPMGAVVARLAAKKSRKKYHTRVIYTAHGFHFYKGAPLINWLLFYPIEKWLAKYTDNIITINKEDYERAVAKFGKYCSNIHYIPGIGIDLKKFDFNLSISEKKKIRKELGLKEDDFVIIFPARLDKNKNQIFLINCIEKICNEYGNVHLLLPGKDELNGYCQEITIKKKIDNKVHFLGHRDDIPKLLKISNLAVSSSVREGFGLNLVEAIYCDLPVIATTNRGHRDIIINGVNGFLINLSEDEFIEKFKLIYCSKKKYSSSNTAMQFSIEMSMDVVRRIYFEEK